MGWRLGATKQVCRCGRVIGIQRRPGHRDRHVHEGGDPTCADGGTAQPADLDVTQAA